MAQTSAWEVLPEATPGETSPQTELGRRLRLLALSLSHRCYTMPNAFAKDAETFLEGAHSLRVNNPRINTRGGVAEI